MNEILPANPKMVLWSDDDYYRQYAKLSRNDFEKVLNNVALDYPLLSYGNVEMDDGRHNILHEKAPNTLLEHLRDNHFLYVTWFIDENNDLWCRDDTFSTGSNYYLYREFNSDNQDEIMNIKLNLAVDNEYFDCQDILRATQPLGDKLKDNLIDMVLTDSMNQKLKTAQNNINKEEYSNYCLYMSSLISSYLGLNATNSDIDLDVYSDYIKDITNNWLFWDDLHDNQYNQIESMQKYINANKTLLISQFNKCLNTKDIEIENRVEKYLVDEKGINFNSYCPFDMYYDDRTYSSSGVVESITKLFKDVLKDVYNINDDCLCLSTDEISDGKYEITNRFDDHTCEYYFNAWEDADSFTSTCDDMLNDITNYYSLMQQNEIDNSKSL